MSPCFVRSSSRRGALIWSCYVKGWRRWNGLQADGAWYTIFIKRTFLDYKSMLMAHKLIVRRQPVDISSNKAFYHSANYVLIEPVFGYAYRVGHYVSKEYC